MSFAVVALCRGREREQTDPDGAEAVEREEEEALVAVQRASRHPAAGLEAAFLDGVDLDEVGAPAEVQPDALADEEELVLGLGDHEGEGARVGRRRTVRTAVGLAGCRGRGRRFADAGVEQHLTEQGAGVPGHDGVAAEREPLLALAVVEQDTGDPSLGLGGRDDVLHLAEQGARAAELAVRAGVVDAEHREAQRPVVPERPEHPADGEPRLGNEHRVVRPVVVAEHRLRVVDVDVRCDEVEGRRRGLPDVDHPADGATARVVPGLRLARLRTEPGVRVHGQRLRPPCRRPRGRRSSSRTPRP